MQRRREPEHMDQPDAPRDDLDTSLRFIRMVNRHLGGIEGLLRPLRRWTADHTGGRPFTLIDLATGSADIPVAATKWARAHGVELRITAIDNHPTTLALAREHIGRELGSADPQHTGIDLIEADALKLVDRFGPRSFDAAHAGMFIHHLDELPALTALRNMDRLAARGLVWNDLVRSRPAQLGAWLLTRGTPAIVKHDALVSVRAGFKPREARSMAERAGWDAPNVRASVLHQRFVVTSEKWGSRVLREDET